MKLKIGRHKNNPKIIELTSLEDYNNYFKKFNKNWKNFKSFNEEQIESFNLLDETYLYGNPETTRVKHNWGCKVLSKTFKYITHLNIEYWIERGHSKEDGIEMIYSIQSSNNKKVDYTNRLTSTNLQWWINQGFTEPVARMKLLQRQSTFSKKNCIERFGDERGNEIFIQRQNKWQNTLKDKGIKLGGVVCSSGVSNAEIEITDFIKSLGLEVKTQFSLYYQDKDKKRRYDYDIKVGNKLIEYNGIYWHMNNRHYKQNDINPNSGVSAEAIWIKDLHKKQLAVDNGYEFLTVDEDSFKFFKEKNLEYIKHFLITDNTNLKFEELLKKLNCSFNKNDDVYLIKNYKIKIVKTLKNNADSTCINIYQDQIKNNLNVIEHRLKHMLSLDKKMFARKGFIVKSIDVKTARIFLNTYHIQGYCNSTTKLGLFKDHELYGVMTFGSSRYRKHKTIELLRFAIKENVVGGAGKLFKYYIRHFNPKQVLSYADRNWTLNSDNVYQKLGFELINTTNNSYVYVDNNIRYHRSHFTKKQLKLNYNFNDNWNERQYINFLKIDRIDVIGNFVYEYNA